MLPEIPDDEFAAALDGCAAELLWEAAIDRPPVNAVIVAERLGLLIAADDRLTCRARFVRLAPRSAHGGGEGTIVVGPAERPEREQWAVAHEVGESIAWRVYDRLGVGPETAPPDARELIANRLASCLLLPRSWFEPDGRSLDWDLLALKHRYTTASHELIARRMLEMRPPIVVTVCDLGRLVWRRSNAASRLPPLLPVERDLWKQAHVTGRPTAASLDPAATGLERVRCWPVHEPDWKREIMRSELGETQLVGY